MERRTSSRQPSVAWHQRHKRTWLFAQLTPLWRQHYVDLGHCRLRRCRDRLRDSRPSELKELPASFTALAISAASAYGAAKERQLCEFVQQVVELGFSPNDAHHDNPAVVLAAYHGYVSVLDLLLAAGCSLDGHGEYGHALMAAVKNGQHAALTLLLQQPAAAALISASCRATDSMLFMSIEKRDVASVELLTAAGAKLSDHDLACLAANKRARLEKTRLEPMLRELHPEAASVVRWSPALHWSFPTTDRHTLSLLWHTLRRPAAPELLPEVLWLLVFSFVERGWWASRALYPLGRPCSDVLSLNILNEHGQRDGSLPGEYRL